MKTFKSTGKFRKEGDYEIRDLDEICGNCDEILGRHKAFGENCPEQEKKQDVQTSDSSVEQDDEEIWQEVIDSVLAWGDIQPCRNSLKSRYEIKRKC